MKVAASIREKLTSAFAPVVLEIEDQSARHAGHAGATRGDGPHDARPGDVRGQIDWLDQRIRHATDSSSISGQERRHLLGELRSIDRQERGMRHIRGALSPRDTVTIRARLDRMAAHLDASAARRKD